MAIKDWLKMVAPFVIGVLIGGGFTKNRYIGYIIISYVVVMVLFGFLRKKILKIKDSTDKKLAVRNAAVEGINEVIDTTEKGNKLGAKWFDKFYPEYTFYFNVAIFISMIVLLIYKQWIWALVCFLGLQQFIVLNQIFRHTKKIKEE